MEISGAEIHEILRVFVDSNLTSLDLQVGDLALSVTKDAAASRAPVRAADGDRSGSSGHDVGTAPVPSAQQAQPAASRAIQPVASMQQARLVEVTAPLVGVFYRRPAPDKSPYVEVGDLVQANDPVCSISVMKMFTEVLAGTSGRVVEICVADESLVEHGQTMVRIDPGESA